MHKLTLIFVTLGIVAFVSYILSVIAGIHDYRKETMEQANKLFLLSIISLLAGLLTSIAHYYGGM